MTDQTTNPAAEAEALKAKTPPLPSGSILGDAATPPAPAKPAALVLNSDAVMSAINSIQTAQKSIASAGIVTSDLSLANASCTKAIEWLNKALAANAAAPKA
jgi:hypothetical protein